MLPLLIDCEDTRRRSREMYPPPLIPAHNPDGIHPHPHHPHHHPRNQHAKVVSQVALGAEDDGAGALYLMSVNISISDRGWICGGAHAVVEGNAVAVFVEAGH